MNVVHSPGSTLLLLDALTLGAGCASSGGDVAGTQPLRAGARPVVGWADVIVDQPDPRVVTTASLRARIVATGLPWHVRDRSSGIDLLLIPPGEYARGAEAETGRQTADSPPTDQLPAHRVTISSPFYLGRFEVTNAEYRRSMGDHASGVLADGERRPVVFVSWDEAAALCMHRGLQLPTEGEWEYACRAGTTGVGYENLDDVPWNAGDSGGATHPVDQRQPKAFGLSDMLGNVWEWCADRYAEDTYARCAGGVTDSVGISARPAYVLRGGFWENESLCCRASARASCDRRCDMGNSGFRVARTP